MSVPIYPRIIHASRVDDTRIHMDASVFYAGVTLPRCTPWCSKRIYSTTSLTGKHSKYLS